MRMTGFQVTNYRCIEDSGWVNVDDIAVIVGKNESGKTSLLKALWKFNPFDNTQYDMESEWPRSKWEERSRFKPVVTTKFLFNSEEVQQLLALEEKAPPTGVEGVVISKKYDGSYSFSYYPVSPRSHNTGTWLKELATNYFGSAPETASENFKSKYNKIFSDFIKKIPSDSAYVPFKEGTVSLKEEIKGCLSAETESASVDSDAINTLASSIDNALKAAGNSPWQKANTLCKNWLPIFIYMDDHKAFTGSTDLEEIRDRKAEGKATAEDKTTVMIMEMAGLDLDQVIEQGQEKDKRARTRDIKVASENLTKMMAPYWSQNHFEVQFVVDDQHFSTYLIDNRNDAQIALEEKSQGFQWYFTFDLMFRYETKGQFKGAIILLDEPGLHLHASAQTDLLKRMQDYSQKNQLIYTTHLPFMIDHKRLDNIYIAEHIDNKGTKAHKDWVTADKDAKFTLLAALGINWSNSLLYDRYNLLVEGITDYWYLTAISELFLREGKEGLHSELGIIYAGGGTKAATLATYLNGHDGVKVAALFDHDQEGINAYQQLVNNKILKDKHVLRLDKVLSTSQRCSIEDLFSEEYYVACVKDAYKLPLGKKKIILDTTTRSLIERIEDALSSKGIVKFNKGLVANVILKDLSKKTLSELGPEAISKFQVLITAINNIILDWKSTEITTPVATRKAVLAV